ncbi:pickpocket protein 28-like [Episyrphus balteatus]|uniref:pickpocket protein 28-like n=1 Tax=Episyrphus balteatus TaxID=286459 RepID=UPI002486C77A|nr:pickpocket protein 28-like [Episyrphus balteatus]
MCEKVQDKKSEVLQNKSDEEENSRFYVGLKNNIRDFLLNSTLHGLKYIADDKITVFERSFFGLSFVFVILCSAFFISNIYNKWTDSPIIITTSPQPTLITTIPFPAVTICSLNKALKSRVEEVDRSTLNYTLLMSLCAKDNKVNSLFGQLSWKNFKLLLMRVAQPCEAMLAYCRFGSKPESCIQIFDPVLTDEGLCCTFNALDPLFLMRNYSDDARFTASFVDDFVPIDWTPEKGFSNSLPPKFYPRIAAGTGSQMGLTVVLNASASEYYCSSSKSIGFKVLVHNPAEQPKISSFGFLITAGRESRISIDPQYQTAVPQIRGISTKIRQCLFSDEGNLIFYRTYSRKNCQLECEAQIIFEHCGCILYYLPKIDPDTKICGPKDNRCTKLIQSEIQSSSGNYSCDSCLPACFELSYNPTVTATKMVNGDFITNDDYPAELMADVQDVTIIHFYYLTNVFRSTTKGEIFGFTEFLFLRPHCDRRTKKRQKRKSERNLRNNNVWMTPIKARKPIRMGNIKNWPTEKKNAWYLQQFFNNRDIASNDEVFPYIS